MLIINATVMQTGSSVRIQSTGYLGFPGIAGSLVNLLLAFLPSCLGFLQRSSVSQQDQDQSSEPEAESQVQSTSDNVLHAVSIPAYETHCWKEDSCSPNLDGDLAQGANKI